MNLDDMREGWRQHHGKWADQHFDALAADVVARAGRFENQIMRRDWMETAAALFVILFFGVALSSMGMTRLMVAGVALILFGAVEIVVVLFWARLRDLPPQPDSSLAEFSQAELVRLDRQIYLLRNVTWWYTGPLLAGVALFLFGVLWSLPAMPPVTWFSFLAAFGACLLAGGFIVYRINRRAVVTELLPLREQIIAFRESLASSAEVKQPPGKAGE
jgi:hypothetical protein